MIRLMLVKNHRYDSRITDDQYFVQSRHGFERSMLVLFWHVILFLRPCPFEFVPTGRDRQSFSSFSFSVSGCCSFAVLLVGVAFVVAVVSHFVAVHLVVVAAVF